MWDSHTFKADEIVHVFYLQRFKYRFCRYSHLDTISIALFRFIPFIIVRPIDTFEYHLPVINTVCQCLTQQRTQLQIVYWASFHRLQIQDLIHVLPVNNNGKPFFQDHVKPNAGRSPVPFHERVRHVHFHVFRYDLVKCSCRHLLYHG